jgi:hypothetical protein
MKVEVFKLRPLLTYIFLFWFFENRNHFFDSSVIKKYKSIINTNSEAIF